MEEREKIDAFLSFETFSAPERLADENEEPGRLADKGFKTGRDANIVGNFAARSGSAQANPFSAPAAACHPAGKNHPGPSIAKLSPFFGTWILLEIWVTMG
jgi:hypothetical protein